MERDRIVGTALAAYSGAPAAAVDATRYDYSTRLVRLTPEIERRLSEHAEARERHAQGVTSIDRLIAWLSPTLAFQGALELLAGTGAGRHRRFSGDVRRFQRQLRAFMYPRVLRQAATPAPATCQECAARLNFLDFDEIPRFSFPDPTSLDRAIAAIRSAVWLFALAIAAIAWGWWFNRGWGL